MDSDVEGKVLQAACAKNLALLQSLVVQGANVEATDNDGRTALCFSASNGDLDMMQYLIESANANTNARCAQGATILMLGADAGHLGVVRYLVECVKVDINATDDFGLTALMRASLLGHLEVVCFLARHTDMDIQAEDHLGRTALDHARNANRLFRGIGNDEAVKVVEQLTEIIVKKMLERATKALKRDTKGLHMLHPMILNFANEARLKSSKNT
uniref:Uncharacterized protein n=1 Tax=Lotharella globosa TaxID=91324 RepID=A0A7S3YVK4_9EUKA